MKKVFMAITCLAASVSGFAQAGKVPAANVKASPHIKVFNLAAETGDINSAILALNYYIAEQGGNNAYADTLAMMYMQNGAYVQSYYWADKRLKDKPTDLGLMEIKAICLDKLQQPKEAIDMFEKLYARSQSPFHAYKLMELQYSIKRLQECLVTAMSAERLQYKPDYTMNYNVGERVGRTYLQAGIFNIHGLALYDLDKKAEAKSYFEKAVALDSNFVLARQNLEAMRSMESGAVKPNPTTGAGAPPANKQN